MKSPLKIKKGREISLKFIEQWNDIMHKAFGEDKPLNPKNRKGFAKDIFFILQNEKKELLSVGRLKPIKIKFLNKIYNILGIADMVSIIKKKGYGKKVIKAMYKYVTKRKKSQISFCHPKNTLFYKKCGLGIIKNAVRRFYYKDKKGKIHKNPRDKDVVYIEGKDQFIEKILSYPKEKIKLPINFF